MHGNRTLLKMELQKQRMELDRQREEDDTRRKRDMIGIQKSASMEVPSSQGQTTPTVTVDVPPTILEVGSFFIFYFFWTWLLGLARSAYI